MLSSKVNDFNVPKLFKAMRHLENRPGGIIGDTDLEDRPA